MDYLPVLNRTPLFTSSGTDLRPLINFLIQENVRLGVEELAPLDPNFDFESSLSLLPTDLAMDAREALDLGDLTYKFDEADDLENCVEMESGELEGCSLTKLVEKMTEGSNNELMNVVLYTYPVYTDSRTLLKLLIDRYNMPLPPLMSHTERCYFETRKLRNVQSKVASVMKRWIKDWPHLFAPHSELRDMLNEFLQSQEPQSALITRAVAQTLNSVEDNQELVFRFSELTVPPPPILPREMDFKAEPLLLWNPVEIARQLTLIDLAYLKRVRIEECLERKWEKKPAEAPNIVALADRFGFARALLTLATVSVSDFTNRVKVFKKLLETSHEALLIGNFETPFVISSALKSDAFVALHRSTKEVMKSAMHKSMWNRLDTLYSSDFSTVRSEMLSANCLVPCFLALRQELNRADISLPNFLENRLINLRKHRLSAETINRLRQFQDLNVPFHRVAMLHDYLSQDCRVEDEALHKMAVELEPN
mmetsp:Transcript_5350/g.9818  ORF Transcript_5350/g.9818 Transcript_5350/m.9818 type:complete len:481 (+) Transcript_5350:1731-3173(+)